MEQYYQELVATLTGRHNILLTSLLSSDDPDSWEQSKYIIISHAPLLTLEMAVNRICQRRPNVAPTPAQIYAALEYAKKKNQQYAKNSTPSELSN